MPNILIHNVETGEVIEREMTESEEKQLLAQQKTAQLERQKQLDKVTARIALLEKLGITEEEAKLLLS